MKINNSPELWALQIGDTYVKSGVHYIVVDDSLGNIQVEIDNPLRIWKKRKK